MTASVTDEFTVKTPPTVTVPFIVFVVEEVEAVKLLNVSVGIF